MHLADAFIQRDLQLHSGYTFSLVHVFPGNRTHNLLRINMHSDCFTFFAVAPVIKIVLYKHLYCAIFLMPALYWITQSMYLKGSYDVAKKRTLFWVFGVMQFFYVV